MPRVSSEFTSVEVSRVLHAQLVAARYHPRQSFDQLLGDVLAFWVRHGGYASGWTPPYGEVGVSSVDEAVVEVAS